MAESDDTLAQESAPTSSVVLGATLQKAREDKSLSIEQVCARLRISARQVNAMEADDFDVLGDAMIVRGFIRNYAKLLEIDPEPLVAQYMASKPNAEPKSLSLNSANIAIQSYHKQDWQKYVGLSLLIGVLVGAWYFYTDYQATLFDTADVAQEAVAEKSATTTQQATVEPNDAVPAQQPPADSTALSTPPMTTSTTELTADPKSAVSAGSQPMTEASSSPSEVSTVASTDGTDQLRVNTGEASWVHVLDADNKVILDAIVPANGEALAEGKAPFNVVIGNAPVATIQFNHQSIDLTPYTKGRVARLKLE